MGKNKSSRYSGDRATYNFKDHYSGVKINKLLHIQYLWLIICIFSIILKSHLVYFVIDSNNICLIVSVKYFTYYSSGNNSQP